MIMRGKKPLEGNVNLLTEADQPKPDVIYRVSAFEIKANKLPG